MISLRAQLLLWLLPLYLLSAVTALGVSYLQYHSSISAFMDGQMHRLALAYVQRLRVDPQVPPVTSLSEEEVEHDGTVILQIWNRDGRLLASTWPIPGATLQTREGFRNVAFDDRTWRVYTAAVASPRVQVMQSGSFRNRVILDSALKSAEPIAWLVPFTILVLWFAVWFALRPLDRLARDITAQDERSLIPLSSRQVPVEIKPLLISMNGLLVRLKSAFAAQQRFVQDAAHELRTPLTALKLQLESLRTQVAGDQAARLDAGVQRMQRLVEQLLKLAHQEASPLTAEHIPVDLAQVLRQSMTELVPLAEARDIDLGLVALEPCEVHADARDLRTVFDNLLDNALHYTPPGGRVDVSLKQVEGRPQVEFLDTGPGIPPELLERVFDRFYRVLGTGVEGSGLGLAIARGAASRAGWLIELSNRGDHCGLAARVRFVGI